MATQNSVVPFEVRSLAVSRGKGSNAQSKAALAIRQGAMLGVLIGQKVSRKAIIDGLVANDMQNLIMDIANNKYERPMATIVAISQRPYTYTLTEGNVPRSDWLRLRAELGAADSKAAAKARALFDEVQVTADEVRKELETQRKADEAKAEAERQANTPALSQ